MKKKLCLIFSILLVLSMTVFNICYADEFPSISTLDSGDGGKVGTAAGNVVGAITQIIRIVGTGIALIMITYVAIKYMSAAPEEKAEFKKSAVGFIVGAVVLFAGTNLVKIIADFATTNISATS